MDYTERKSWSRYSGVYYSRLEGSISRFAVRKAPGTEKGGWKISDFVTGETAYCGAFSECRRAASRMAERVSKRTPGEYRAGMEAYTATGKRVRIDSFGPNGYDCRFTFLDGVKKGSEGYISEVNHLYIEEQQTETAP